MTASCAEEASAYSLKVELDKGPQRQVRDLLPPFDLSPNFPNILFDKYGVPHPGSPGGIHNAVVQIVPDKRNWYAQNFGRKCRIDWTTPEGTIKFMEDCFRNGRRVEFHARKPGIQTFGTGRGKARFIVGGGISIFVRREIGPLPDSIMINGNVEKGMVATLGVSIPKKGGFPDPNDSAVACHLIPIEYLADQIYPGLPLVLSPRQMWYWLPPPPRFTPGSSCKERRGFWHANVTIYMSKKEDDEDGHEILFNLMRGSAYYILRGLTTPY